MICICHILFKSLSIITFKNYIRFAPQTSRQVHAYVISYQKCIYIFINLWQESHFDILYNIIRFQTLYYLTSSYSSFYSSSSPLTTFSHVLFLSPVSSLLPHVPNVPPLHLMYQRLHCIPYVMLNLLVFVLCYF